MSYESEAPYDSIMICTMATLMQPRCRPCKMVRKMGYALLLDFCTSKGKFESGCCAM